MPRTYKPSTIFVIAAFTMHQPKTVLYRKATNMPTLQRLVAEAIDQGAVVISIRKILPPPQGRLLQETQPQPSDHLTTTEAVSE